MKKMKYKVLAADDEYWSRENLRSLISWEDYSIEFLDPACDGEEVLERIEEEKPDIISRKNSPNLELRSKSLKLTRIDAITFPPIWKTL